MKTARSKPWVYPLKLIDDFKLSFQLQGYPLEIEGAQIATGISVRPNPRPSRTRTPGSRSARPCSRPWTSRAS
jgi:hypothetical protein